MYPYICTVYVMGLLKFTSTHLIKTRIKVMNSRKYSWLCGSCVEGWGLLLYLCCLDDQSGRLGQLSVGYGPLQVDMTCTLRPVFTCVNTEICFALSNCFKLYLEIVISYKIWELCRLTAAHGNFYSDCRGTVFHKLFHLKPQQWCGEVKNPFSHSDKGTLTQCPRFNCSYPA